MCSTKSAQSKGTGMSSRPEGRYLNSLNPFSTNYWKGMGPIGQWISETRAKMKGVPRTPAEVARKKAKDAISGSGSSISYRIPTRDEDKLYDPATGLRR